MLESRITVAIIAAIAVTFAGCQVVDETPDTPAPTSFAIEVDVRDGSLLRALPQKEPAPPQRFLTASATVYALDGTEPLLFPAPTEEIEIVHARSGDAALLPFPRTEWRVADRARVESWLAGRAEPAGHVAVREALLAPARTVRFSLGDDAPRLWAHWSGTDLARMEYGWSDPGRSPIHLLRPPKGDDPFFIAFAWRNSPGALPEAFLATLTLEPLDPTATSLADAVARFEAQPRSSSHTSRANGAASQPPTESRVWRGLDSPRHRRTTLLFLAREHGAPFAVELALVADDDVLAKWSTLLNEARAKAAPNASKALGIILERSAIGTTLARIEDGEAPEYFALLTVHAGELARHGSSLADLAGRATTVDELHGAIAGENRVFLEDPSPSARVRSYEWLRRREQAPTDFDPLASRDERRRALRGESTGSAETPTAETPTAEKDTP